MRYRLASLARALVGFVVRHTSEDSLSYLRYAGIAVEEFTPSADPELVELEESRRLAS